MCDIDPRADTWGSALPRQHGVEQDPQTPDVTRRVIALPLQDLDREKQVTLEFTARGSDVTVTPAGRERAAFHQGGAGSNAPTGAPQRPQTGNHGSCRRQGRQTEKEVLSF